jgi:hypothetical protein
MIKREAPERQSEKGKGEGQKKRRVNPFRFRHSPFVFLAACLPLRSPTGFLRCDDSKV